MDYRLRTYIIGNGFGSFGMPLMDMTLLWLLYEILKNPILYIPIASARPIAIILFSSISGYISDKLDRRIILLVFGLLNRIFVIATLISIIFNQPILSIVFFLIRTIGQVNTQLAGSAAFLQILPKDYVQRGMFFNRLVKESLTIIGILIWPFVFYNIGGLVAVIGVVVSLIGLLIQIRIDLGGRGKEIHFRDGFIEYLKKKNIFFISIVTAITQGALSMVYLYPAALIQIMHGTTFQYTIVQIGFYGSWLVGSWIMMKYKSPVKIIITSMFLNFLVFILLIPFNPWLIALSVASVGLGDSIHELLWIKIFRTASEKLLGSVYGVDEFVTNLFRLGYDSIAGYFYTVDFTIVPIIGLLTITAVSISYAFSKSWRIKI